MKNFKRVILMLMFSIFVLSACGNEQIKTVDSQYDGLDEYYQEDMKENDYTVVKAKILEIKKDDTKEIRPDTKIESDRRFQYLRVEILQGKHAGEQFTLRNTIEMINPYRLVFKTGEKLYIYVWEDEFGEVNNIHIYEKVRDVGVIWIIISFLVLLILIGKMKGLKTIVTLSVTVFLITFVLLPLILKGYNPIVVTTIIVAIISTFSLVVISGWNIKTRTAILGTLGGVIIAAIIAYIATYAASLTGLGSEQAMMLGRIPEYRNLDFKGVLLAGIIIGALGAVMDVALSISSAMWEIEENSPKITSSKLMKSGMNIGKDMMGSMSNTLILAYVGSAMQLLLLFVSYNMSIAEILNMDMIATEIVQAVAGSIGLIASIPLTTWIGAYWGRIKK